MTGMRPHYSLASVVFFGQESMSRKNCGFYYYISNFSVTALLKCKMAYICLRLHKSSRMTNCNPVSYMLAMCTNYSWWSVWCSFHDFSCIGFHCIIVILIGQK